MIRLTVALAVLAAAACAPPAEVADTLPAPSADGTGSLTGTIRIVGSAPVNVQTVVQPRDGGRSVRVTGPLTDELGRLNGVEVALRGRIDASPDPMVDRQIEVSAYDIVSVDGRPVVSGEIVSIQAGRAVLRTDRGEEVVLAGAPADFAVGQKVWVQGVHTLSVQSYGTIRP